MEPNDALQQLEAFGFSHAIDHFGEFGEEGHLYFLKIDIEEHLIFHHLHPDAPQDKQRFDCWLGTYKFTEFIGKVPAIEREEIKRDFDFAADWQLLAKYFQFG